MRAHVRRLCGCEDFCFVSEMLLLVNCAAPLTSVSEQELKLFHLNLTKINVSYLAATFRFEGKKCVPVESIAKKHTYGTHSPHACCR